MYLPWHILNTLNTAILSALIRGAYLIKCALNRGTTVYTLLMFKLSKALVYLGELQCVLCFFWVEWNFVCEIPSVRKFTANFSSTPVHCIRQVCLSKRNIKLRSSSTYMNLLKLPAYSWIVLWNLTLFYLITSWNKSNSILLFYQAGADFHIISMYRIVYWSCVTVFARIIFQMGPYCL